MRKIDEAFKADHQILEKLRAGRDGRLVLMVGDSALKAIRQAGVMAIHMTDACASQLQTGDKSDKKQGDDEDDDEDDDQQSGQASSHHDNSDGDKHRGSSVPKTILGEDIAKLDPMAIAAKAVTAMDTIVADVQKVLPSAAPTTSASPRPTRSPEPATTNNKKDDKHKGR